MIGWIQTRIADIIRRLDLELFMTVAERQVLQDELAELLKKRDRYEKTVREQSGKVDPDQQ